MLELTSAVLVGVLAVLAAFVLRSVLKWRTSPKLIPPGWNKPPADPKMGDLRVAASSGSLYHYVRQRHRGGRCPVFSFWWRNERVVSTCSRDAFIGTENLYNRPQVIFAQRSEPLHGSSGIQSINGTEWEERRKLLQGMIRGRKLDSFFGDFVRIAQETEMRWSPTGKPIHLMKEMFRMSLKAILCTSLGNIFEDDSGIESLANYYHLCKCEMDQRILESPPSKSLRELEFQKNLTCLRDTLRQMMNTRKEQRNGRDLPLLDTLLASGASEQQVFDDMVTFMGGFHSAALYMTWLFYYLAQHPDIQEKLYKEIEERVEGEHADKLKVYALTSNSFLRQVIDEALRMSATATISGHYSDKDAVVDGYHVPAKTPILHAIGIAMNDKAVWEQPDRFNPDRFAPGSKHSKRGPEFRPFGVSRMRRCPASQFTYFMVSVYVTILLQRFVIVYVTEDEEVPERTYGVATSPKGEIYLQVKFRHQE